MAPAEEDEAAMNPPEPATPFLAATEPLGEAEADEVVPVGGVARDQMGATATAEEEEEPAIPPGPDGGNIPAFAPRAILRPKAPLGGAGFSSPALNSSRVARAPGGMQLEARLLSAPGSGTRLKRPALASPAENPRGWLLQFQRGVPTGLRPDGTGGGFRCNLRPCAAETKETPRPGPTLRDATEALAHLALHHREIFKRHVPGFDAAADSGRVPRKVLESYRAAEPLLFSAGTAAAQGAPSSGLPAGSSTSGNAGYQMKTQDPEATAKVPRTPEVNRPGREEGGSCPARPAAHLNSDVETLLAHIKVQLGSEDAPDPGLDAVRLMARGDVGLARRLVLSALEGDAGRLTPEAVRQAFSEMA